MVAKLLAAFVKAIDHPDVKDRKVSFTVRNSTGRYGTFFWRLRLSCPRSSLVDCRKKLQRLARMRVLFLPGTDYGVLQPRGAPAGRLTC